MHQDLDDLVDASALRTEVCIVGAGAAGITAARRLIAAGHEVTLLESGGLDYERETADLNKGENLGLPYYRLEDARLRFFGGTTAIWGGRCAELDAIDFERRDYVPYSGWPFGKSEIEPYYRQARALFGIHDAPDAAALRDAGVPIPDFAPDRLGTPIWTFDAKADRFTFDSVRDLADHPRFRAVIHATVVALMADPSGRVLEAVKAKSTTGRTLTVRADAFVLATGGIENPRLLLASRGVNSAGLGNGYDQVGRYFMEHPHARGGRIADAAAWQLLHAFGRRHRHGGQDVAALITLASEVQRRRGVLNPSLTIVARPRVEGRQALGMRAYSRIKHEMAPTRFGRSLWLAAKRGAGFAQRHVDPLRPWLLHRAGALDIALLVRAEQAPDPDSRVTLSRKVDALGLPRAALDWRLSPLDVRSVRVLVETLGEELERLGLGRVEPAQWLSGMDWEFDRLVSAHPVGGYHHMGTTRMAGSPRSGVVDAAGRVHGIENLYVAGSSLFPTGSWANPTLTITALALRGADHLSRRLRTAPARPVAAMPKSAAHPRDAEKRIPAEAAARLARVPLPAARPERWWRSGGVAEAVGDWMTVGGLIACVLAPAILLIECFEWLTSREWPGLTVADGLALFGLEHSGPETAAQRLLDLMMAVPLTIALFLVGISMFLAGVNLADWGVRQDIDRRRLGHR